MMLKNIVIIVDFSWIYVPNYKYWYIFYPISLQSFIQVFENMYKKLLSTHHKNRLFIMAFHKNHLNSAHFSMKSIISEIMLV